MTEQIIILTLSSIAICATMWEGMVLERFGDWVEEKVGEWWAKPLGKCYVCATFWMSVVICLITGWPPFLAIPAMGLSAVISLFHD